VRIVSGTVPFLALILLTWRFRQRWGSWRISILSAAVVWGVVLTVITEGLSLLRLLSFWWVLAAWLAIAVAALAMKCPSDRPAMCDGPTEAWRVGRWWLAVAGSAVILLATGFIAVVAPPNTWDSLVYHMPRVAHWIQNGTVAHYPTHIPKQLHLAPWAEFAILQPQILSGGDRFANLVQWLAMLGCLVGVSLIARQLGGSLRSQVVAAVVCVTIPMGILQASGTQNDYVVAFWLVCFAYYACALIGHEDDAGDARRAWWMGASLGLAVLTKATAYLISLPFLTWVILDSVRHRRKHLWRTLGIVGLAVLFLNLGHYWRNIEVFGSPFGPGREGPLIYANETFGPSVLVSNAARNIALHLGTPQERVNATLESGIKWLHRQLGADINDPKTTWLTTPFHVTPPRIHDGLAGNLAHSVLIAVSCALLLRSRVLRRRVDVLAYAAALVAAFLLFASYLKWQPWHSRLHLPLFVLWSPCIAVIWGSYRRMAGVLVAVLLVLSVPWIVYNESRPLLGPYTVLSRSRLDQYFSERPQIREPYVAAMRELRAIGCSTLSLQVGGDAAEYPVWILAGQAGGEGQTRIEHIQVENASAGLQPYARGPFDPCATLVVTELPFVPVTLLYNGSVYRLRRGGSPVGLFVRE
jgi:hypothetical protein